MFLAKGVDHGRVDVEAQRAKLGDGHLQKAESRNWELAKSLTQALADLVMSIHHCNAEQNRSPQFDAITLVSAFSGFTLYLAGQETSPSTSSQPCKFFC